MQPLSAFSYSDIELISNFYLVWNFISVSFYKLDSATDLAELVLNKQLSLKILPG